MPRQAYADSTIKTSLDLVPLLETGVPNTAEDWIAFFDMSAGFAKKVLLSGVGSAFDPSTTKLSAFAATTSAELAGVISDETGTDKLVFNTSPTLVTPLLGTPTSGVLTNCTGLPVSTGISGLGTGVAALLATFSSANLASAVTDETGSGALMFGTAPTITTSLTLNGTLTQTSSSATAFESGPNGATNPVFRLVNNIASAATGLSVTGNAAGSGVTLTALSSGSNEDIKINPKGSGAVSITTNAGTLLSLTDSQTNGFTLQIIEDGASIGRAVIKNTTGNYLKLAGTNGGNIALVNNTSFDVSPVNGVGWFRFAQGGLYIGANTTPTYALQIAPTANVTAGQTVFIQDATASTGATKVIIKAGAGQSTTTLLELQNNAAAIQLSVSGAGLLKFNGLTGIAENAAGIVEINNGTAGAFRDLKLRSYTWAMQGFVTSDLTTTSTTLAAVTLSQNPAVLSGKKYGFKLVLYVSDSLAADGAKFDFNGGTATSTNFRAHATIFDSALNVSTQVSALNTAITATTLTGSSLVEIHGAFEPSGDGTFIPQFAQAAHTTGTLTIFRGSHILMWEIA